MCNGQSAHNTSPWLHGAVSAVEETMIDSKRCDRRAQAVLVASVKQNRRLCVVAVKIDAADANRLRGLKIHYEHRTPANKCRVGACTEYAYPVRERYRRGPDSRTLGNGHGVAVMRCTDRGNHSRVGWICRRICSRQTNSFADE